MGFDLAIRGQNILLDVIFKNGLGANQDPDGWDPGGGTEPVLQIIDPFGVPFITLVGNELTKADVGVFNYTFAVPSTASLGLWKANWSARIDSIVVQDEDIFNVSDAISQYQIALIDRIKKELKQLTDQLEEDDYPDIIVDAQADVRLLPPNGLAGTNLWETAWLTKRGVRHSLQRIINNWLTLFDISKAGKSLSLGSPQDAIRQRIDQIDKQWEKEREKKKWDGEHWIDKQLEVKPKSTRAVYNWDVDSLTGEDRTEFAPDENGPPRRNPNYDDTFEY